jgi:tripartite-type tricarboxylate transporter receptor subunit TctC
MKQFAVSIALLVLPPALVLPEAVAADYPTKAITSIIPFGPGGASDVLLRIMASVLKDYIGQPIVSLNKPGAAGTIAGNTIAKATPDGYTFGALVSTGAVPEIYRYFHQSPYTSADLRPVIRIATIPYALFVKSDSPWRTLNDFLSAARANPDGFTYAHAGRGHVYHLFMTAVARKAGVNIEDIAVEGGAPAITIVLGGHVQASVAATSAGKEQVAAGKLRMLAVQHRERLAWAPDVPTFAEAGYAFGFAPWYNSVFVPAKTPNDVVGKLHETMRTAMNDSRYVDQVEKVGLAPDYGSPDDVRRDLEADIRVIGGMLKTLNMYK